MKKVICISGVKVGDIGRTNNGEYAGARPQDVIIEGEYYTVIAEVEWRGVVRYVLEEIGWDSSYSKDKFIPLSDIDETEMTREKIVRQYEQL